MTLGRFAEFVGSTAARDIVDGYDPATDRWGFSFDSPFWKAVRHAQSLGRRGAGHRVAIIDSGCDLRIPRLKRRVDLLKSFVPDPADKDALGHGTAVALLISEVAPDCRLDIYQVARDGKPDVAAVLDALKAASESGADVLNISIAVMSPFQFTPQQLQAAIEEGDGSGKKYAHEADSCGLCAAATAASETGRLVFAAAGNAPNTASCPARAKGVAAAGFASSETKIASVPTGGLQSAVFAAGPGAPQSLLLDLSLREIDGVLGTSFAAPLFSGAGALGLSQKELNGYIACNGAAAFPQLFQGLIRSNVLKAAPELVRQISRWYVAAQSKLPHVHCTYQSQVNPGIPATDPHACFACGIFAEPPLVNHGLWLLETHRTEDAKSLLEAARTVAPWSADATANLGATVRELGDIPGAIALYERALELRPRFSVYTSELKRLRKRLPGGGSWWSRIWS